MLERRCSCFNRNHQYAAAAAFSAVPLNRGKRSALELGDAAALAGMARFVIADISNPKSSPLELQATVPNYMIPFVPILQMGEAPFSMFQDLKQKYGDWVLDVLEYDSLENLRLAFEPAIIVPALEKHAELAARKAREIVKRDIRSYLPRS